MLEHTAVETLRNRPLAPTQNLDDGALAPALGARNDRTEMAVVLTADPLPAAQTILACAAVLREIYGGIAIMACGPTGWRRLVERSTQEELSAPVIGAEVFGHALAMTSCDTEALTVASGAIPLDKMQNSGNDHSGSLHPLNDHLDLKTGRIAL